MPGPPPEAFACLQDVLRAERIRIARGIQHRHDRFSAMPALNNKCVSNRCTCHDVAFFVVALEGECPPVK